MTEDFSQFMAYEKGKSAAMSGQPASSNPYAEGSVEHKSWTQGHAYILQRKAKRS